MSIWNHKTYLHVTFRFHEKNHLFYSDPMKLVRIWSEKNERGGQSTVCVTGGWWIPRIGQTQGVQNLQPRFPPPTLCHTYTSIFIWMKSIWKWSQWDQDGKKEKKCQKERLKSVGGVGVGVVVYRVDLLTTPWWRGYGFLLEINQSPHTSCIHK